MLARHGCQGLLVSLTLAASACPGAALACKNPNLEVTAFISRWNDAVVNLTDATWKLAEYNKLGFIRQNLDTGDLLLAADVGKDGCITKLEIRSSRELVRPMGGLVAWSTAIRTTNPQASADERKAIMEKLGIHKPSLAAGGKASLAGLTYEFEEDTARNVLSITPE